MAAAAWGGSEELWSQTALRLFQEGHEVSGSVIWRAQLSPKVVALGESGVKIFLRKKDRPSLPSRLWRKIKRQFYAEDPEEFQWLKKRRPDLVIISQGGISDGIECMIFCAEAGLPFFAITHCNTEGGWPQDDAADIMAKAYRAARKVLCVSLHNLELLERQIGEPLPNASVVRNPYNVPADQPAVWPAKNGTWKFACVARLDPAAKGQDLLFQVLALSHWRDREMELNLYGTGGCAHNLQKLVKRLELKSVHFHGHVADVKKIWDENHLLVLPSRFEGLPLALVEAMWCARPAVVTDIGGNAELCVDEETGFVAAAPAVNLINEALERAWKHRDDWEKMGQAARARVEKLVPKDPVRDFCKLLVEYAKKI